MLFHFLFVKINPLHLFQTSELFFIKLRWSTCSSLQSLWLFVPTSASCRWSRVGRLCFPRASLAATTILAQLRSEINHHFILLLCRAYINAICFTAELNAKAREHDLSVVSHQLDGLERSLWIFPWRVRASVSSFGGTEEVPYGLCRWSVSTLSLIGTKGLG